MTTTVIITRHYSGFINVADSFEIGNTEHENNSATGVYRLPAGYTMHDGRIYDTSDYACEIHPGDDGKPRLYSLAGPCRDQPLTEVP